MASPDAGPSLPVRELSRRRVYLFFAATAVVVLVGVLNEESDKWLHALDDIAIFLLMAVVVAFLAYSWKRQAEADLRRQNNVALALTGVALLFQIAAIPIELGDPSDFGNEIPFLIILLAMVANRFV